MELQNSFIVFQFLIPNQQNISVMLTIADWNCCKLVQRIILLSIAMFYLSIILHKIAIKHGKQWKQNVIKGVFNAIVGSGISYICKSVLAFFFICNKHFLLPILVLKFDKLRKNVAYFRLGITWQKMDLNIQNSFALSDFLHR